MVKVRTVFDLDPKEMRIVYNDALCKAAAANGRVVAINCDLCSSLGLKGFVKDLPPVVLMTRSSCAQPIRS